MPDEIAVLTPEEFKLIPQLYKHVDDLTDDVDMARVDSHYVKRLFATIEALQAKCEALEKQVTDMANDVYDNASLEIKVAELEKALSESIEARRDHVHGLDRKIEQLEKHNSFLDEFAKDQLITQVERNKTIKALEKERDELRAGLKSVAAKTNESQVFKLAMEALEASCPK